MANDKLLTRVHELIASTGWAEDKQKQWLAKHQCKSWDGCSEATLLLAIEKLELFDGMFHDACIDTGIESGNDDSEVNKALRVYMDE